MSTITIKDIPESDLARYRAYVQATFKKKPSGKYVVDYRLKYPSGEKAKHSTKTFDLRREADAYITQLTDEHVIALYKLEHPENTLTFQELYDEYEASRAFKDKQSTIKNRKSIVTSRILPFFGDLLIQDVSEERIEEWQRCFINSDGNYIFSACYLRSLHSRLSAILNFAVKKRYIQVNPASTMSIGAKDGPEKPVWTPSEYLQFRKCIEGMPMFYYAFETLYHTGMRRGEMLALTVSDIDLKHKNIHVNKTLFRMNGKAISTSPKTAKSVRVVRIGDALCEELREHIASLPDKSPDALVFPVSVHQLRTALDRGTSEAQLHRITIHCFRHSHITNLIHKRFSPSDIAKRVGHESVYITLHYAHAFKGVENEMANAIDSMMKEVE